MSAPAQPRDAVGRFATTECPRVYALLDRLAPAGDAPDERPNYTAVPAPRCPHGHFTRWAGGFSERGAPNCPPCHRGG